MLLQSLPWIKLQNVEFFFNKQRQHLMVTNETFINVSHVERQLIFLYFRLVSFWLWIEFRNEKYSYTLPHLLRIVTFYILFARYFIETFQHLTFNLNNFKGFNLPFCQVICSMGYPDAGHATSNRCPSIALTVGVDLINGGPVKFQKPFMSLYCKGIL